MFRNVNLKKLGLTIIVLFIYIFATDFLIHGNLLSSLYMETASLWRTEAEMHQHFVWMLMGQALGAIFFSLIFAKGYEGRGIGEGLRFGVLMAGFSTAGIFIEYAVSPLPPSILGSWVGFGFVQFVGAGAVASLVYRR